MRRRTWLCCEVSWQLLKVDTTKQEWRQLGTSRQEPSIDTQEVFNAMSHLHYLSLERNIY